MPTFNLAVGGNAALPAVRSGEQYIVEKLFDATKQNLAQNDIAQLINIPAQTWVPLVQWEVETVEGGARNFSIGDGVNAAGFVPSTSANALASGVSGPLAGSTNTSDAGAAADPLVVTGYSGGKYYAAADTIDLTALTAGGLTGAKIRVKAVMVPLA